MAPAPFASAQAEGLEPCSVSSSCHPLPQVRGQILIRPLFPSLHPQSLYQKTPCHYGLAWIIAEAILLASPFLACSPGTILSG